MGPPPDRKRKRQAVVLDEDEYEAAMTEIIRRDFFPDNRRLTNQLEVSRVPNTARCTARMQQAARSRTRANVRNAAVD